MLVLCVGEKNEVRITPIIRTLRTHSELPLVVMAKSPNKDWYKTVETTKIYYMKGNPLSLFDLER